MSAWGSGEYIERFFGCVSHLSTTTASAARTATVGGTTAAEAATTTGSRGAAEASRTARTAKATRVAGSAIEAATTVGSAVEAACTATSTVAACTAGRTAVAAATGGVTTSATGAGDEFVVVDGGAGGTFMLVGGLASGGIAIMAAAEAAVIGFANGVASASATRVVVVNAATGVAMCEAGTVVARTISAGTVSDGTAVVPPEASAPVIWTTGSVEAVVEVVASVAAAITPKHTGMIVVEVTHAVVAVDWEVPSATQPGDGIQKVVRGGEYAPLPIEEDVAKVGIAVCEVVAIDNVALRGEAEEVVEVDFVAVVVLLVVEVELVGHLIGEETGFFASTFVAHSVSGECAAGEDECEDKLFHCSMILRG